VQLLGVALLAGEDVGEHAGRETGGDVVVVVIRLRGHEDEGKGTARG
jgi:hypothetical protein